MYEYYDFMHVYAPHMYMVLRETRTTLEPQLLMVVNYHVGAKNQSQALCKISQIVNGWAICPAMENNFEFVFPFSYFDNYLFS